MMSRSHVLSTSLVTLALAAVSSTFACSSDPAPGTETDSGTTTTLPDGAPIDPPEPGTDGGTTTQDGSVTPPPKDGGTTSPANVVGNGGIAAWQALSATEKAKVKTAKTLFLHQSVGQDIENGVESGPDGLTFKSYSSGATVAAGLNGAIFRVFGVDNGNPVQKTQRWQTESTKANGPQIAIMKYGYADVTDALLTTAQNAYSAAVTAVKAKGVKVVHFTAPLVFDASENGPKMKFRDWLVQTYPQDPIFDLVDIESTNPSDGARCETGGVWHICQAVRSTASCLSDQSGSGGDDPSQGHLCPTQATRIAPAFLYAVYLAAK